MLRHLILMAALVLPGFGWEFTYSATTSGPSVPRWNRPLENLSGLSGLGTNVAYHVRSFVAPVTGIYSFISTTTPTWDNFLVLYQGAFSPAAPMTNVIAANDDWPSFGIIGESRISRTLTAGVTYNIVTTGYTNASTGFFNNTVSTPTPEPATWMMIAFGMAVLLLRRRLTPGAGTSRAAGRG
jgi:hypothetical protein